MIQKIYWWILTILTLGIIASGIFSLRALDSDYNKMLSNILESWIIFIISYLILMIIIEIIIQSKKNVIYNNLELINKRVKRTVIMMNQIWDSLKITIVRSVKYIFQSSDERSVNEVRLIREKYKKYGVAKLQDILISYKSQVQHSQLLFTGIMLAMFTALLGGLGQAIINWLRQLLIVNTSPKLKPAEALNMLTTEEMKNVLLIEGLIVIAFILILILGIIFFIDKIKIKQMKILILDDIIKKKAQNE